MKSVHSLGLSLVAATALGTFGGLGACGSNGDDAADAGTDANAIPDGPAVPAEFGLDTRPANATCIAPARPASAASVKWERVYSAAPLDQPMMMAQIPGDSTRWFVAQRGESNGGNASIVSFAVTDPSNVKAVGTVGPLGAMQGEGGLLGLAFHPKFSENGRLYVTWVRQGGGTGYQSEVGYLTSSQTGVTYDGLSFGGYTTVLGPFEQPYSNHNGGGIAFGKDGYLYLGFGDGGARDDAALHGQEKTTFFSKILRIDVDRPDGGRAYGIPDGNPFKNGGGEPATFAYGFRNPFRISVDRESNDLWVGDVGQDQREEINGKVKAGGNYGWPCREGFHDYLNTNAAKCPSGTSGTTDPTVEHEHVPNNSRSITGGVVYRGKAIPNFAGTYVYGDFSRQQMWTLRFDASTGEPKAEQLADAPSASWVSFAEDGDGEVYAVALGQGQIFKLVPLGQAAPSAFPDRLSKTGCVDPADVARPGSGVVPFAVNAELWSDGAQKRRWLAIPDGTKITVKADGDFDFPNGTVLGKDFSVGGKRIETRLFMRHSDGGWAGYTFEWLDDESDAVLLTSSKTKAVGSQTWFFPSRSDCMNCHTEAAGRALAPELGQLNRDFDYPSTRRRSNQLKTLDHVGMFDKPLAERVDQIVAYPDPLGAAGTPELRARAYLHANCSFCHRPQGGGRGAMDLRFATPFAETKTCNGEGEAGDLGIAGAKLLAPGSPKTSLISLRPHSAGAKRMPPLASSVVDDRGIKVVDDWITSVKACP